MSDNIKKIPADKLAAAVNKHLLPGLIRSLQAQKKAGIENEGKKNS